MLSCPACFKPSLRSAQRSIRPSFTSQLFIALFYIAGRDHERGGVVVNFLSQVIFVFLLFLGMVMYANEIEAKEK